MAKASDCGCVVSRENGSVVEGVRCQSTVNLPLPMPVTVWVAAVNAFLKLHRRCGEEVKR